MLKKILLLLVAIVFLTSCDSRQRQTSEEEAKNQSVFDSETHQEFIDNLASLCGKSYRGEQVYRSHHGDSWADRNMIMHVTVCEDDKVHIPFHVDDDHSRTWMFFAEDGKLGFKHQHLHEDGTHEYGSMYGGYATDKGTAYTQYFPADEYTSEVIEGGEGNVWTVSMDKELTWYSYRLDRDGEKRLEIMFDLTEPVDY
ncbi:MAG: hypothetical protein ACLFNU_00360 [Bacteroidales bacterium]